MNSYIKINYVNGSDPPLNAENLNHMDDGIEAVTEAVIAIETEVAAANESLLSKADKATTTAGYGITDAITNTNDSVKTQNIASGAVASRHIANGAVKFYHIEDEAINVNKLGGESVTMPKLAGDTLKIFADANEGKTTFALYSKFFRGQVGSSGTIDRDIKYRVTSENIMKFDYDLN
ncbi:MAG TPA: hypothetical protein DD413_09290, partial [Ruminococcus sp.]|nr:hypothetical protein [Ruminococcus sp.]